MYQPLPYHSPTPPKNLIALQSARFSSNMPR
jgi:hypothetical protein